MIVTIPDDIYPLADCQNTQGQLFGGGEGVGRHKHLAVVQRGGTEVGVI